MENKWTKAFAQNLKLLIGDMSISEFSRKVDIPQQTISRYLLCQREITLSNLCKLIVFQFRLIDGNMQVWNPHRILKTV